MLKSYVAIRQEGEIKLIQNHMHVHGHLHGNALSSSIMQEILFILLLIIANCRCQIKLNRKDGIECNNVVDPKTGLIGVDSDYPVIVSLTFSGHTYNFSRSGDRRLGITKYFGDTYIGESTKPLMLDCGEYICLSATGEVLL